MLLNLINRYYWIIGVVLYALFSASTISNINFATIHFVSFCIFIVYGIAIYNSSLQSNQFYRKRNLAIIVFGISILEVSLFQLLSFYIDGDTFVFSKTDARRYYMEGLRMAQMPLQDGIRYIMNVKGYGIDDLGGFLWISTMFRIVPSQQFLSFSHCIIGTISSVMLFDIARNFMPRRYAFMAALSFASASFIVTHNAQCLKETIMLCTIIASFNCFFIFIKKGKILYLWFTIICVSFTFLFRVPTALLLLLSFALSWVLLYLKGKTAIALSIMILLLISFTPLSSYTYDRYLRGGNTEIILERKNELAGGGGIVNQLTDPIAAFAGPFPSIRIDDVKATPLYASGLLYRFLLAAPFFVGCYFIIRHKFTLMYPFVVFFIANAIGVSISVKGLEARLSMPHLAMMYVVAFWLITKYDYNLLPWTIPKKWINSCFIGVLCLALLWNLR